MNSFDTLFFPETEIFNEKRYPLLLFFTPLHFLQVVAPRPGSTNHDEADLFIKRGLCQAHVPAPLGDKREQFLRLIRDIREHKEHSAGQLIEVTSGTLPALKHGIVTSLLREYGIKEANAETDLQLWQARLVLAIAEILDSSEESLEDQLLLFNDDEIATFRSLQGATDTNEEDLFTELENIKAGLEKSRSGNIKKRFDAWFRLLHKQPIPPVKVWLASTRGSADQIFNKFESTGNTHAVPLLKLALPAQITASGKYVVEQIEKFHQATAHIHRGLVVDFERIVTTVPYVHDVRESLLPYDTDWADQWAEALDDFFPASNYGRNDITFFLLPNKPIARLLSLVPELPGVLHGDAINGLLAVLGTPQTL